MVPSAAGNIWQHNKAGPEPADALIGKPKRLLLRYLMNYSA